MKLLLNLYDIQSHLVAPYAGAWIETWSNEKVVNIRRVAPYAGAWIETVTITATLRGTGRSLRGSVD